MAGAQAIPESSATALREAALPAVLHASAVTHAGNGILILGPSGAGKSSLALQLMALGAGLISDDLVALSAGAGAGAPRLSRPDAAAPDTLIEARGAGLLRAEPAPPAPLRLIVDLGQSEDERLPPSRHVHIAGHAIALLYKVDSAVFPAILVQYLKGGAKQIP